MCFSGVKPDFILQELKVFSAANKKGAFQRLF